jgi:signal transduction histidine kinase
MHCDTALSMSGKILPLFLSDTENIIHIILFLLLAVVIVILLIVMRLINDKIRNSRNLDKQRLKLREKISRDLHDDLASTLGSISIYADTLKRIENPGNSEFEKLTFKIAELTQSALQSITDIIWMTSPKNDSLQGLLAKTNNLLYETLVDNGVQYLAEINAPEEVIVLQDDFKNDIFLILKESTHNIIRHSKASSVTFFSNVNHDTCSITLMDDGIGFDENNLIRQVSHGNGLSNMRRRAEESKIELSIISKPMKGTIVSMSFKI